MSLERTRCTSVSCFRFSQHSRFKRRSLPYSQFFSRKLLREKAFVPFHHTFDESLRWRLRFDIRVIFYLRRYQFDQSTYKMLQRFSSYLLKPLYDRVAWKDQSVLDYDGDKLQSAVTAVMCKWAAGGFVELRVFERCLLLVTRCCCRSNGYQPCIDEALRVFDEWRYNHTAIPPDLQVAVLKTGELLLEALWTSGQVHLLQLINFVSKQFKE